jgi:hypothetical protein
MKWIIVDLCPFLLVNEQCENIKTGESSRFVERMTVNIDDICHVRQDCKDDGITSEKITVIAFHGGLEIGHAVAECKNSFESIIWAIRHAQASQTGCIVDASDAKI